MKTTFTLLLTAISFFLSAQKISQTWCGKNEYAMMRYYRGDTIQVSCDTVFLINTATYSLYADVFKNFNSRTADIKRLSIIFDQSKTLYENRIHQQSVEYEQLKKQFDELVTRSQNVVQETGSKLTSVDNSLLRIDKNVANAQNNIDEVKDLIRKEMRVGSRRKLAWGLGGLALGVIIGGVVLE